MSADAEDYGLVTIRLLNAALEALGDAITVAADKGSHAAVEFVADYLNGCDAVEPKDVAAYDRWLARSEVREWEQSRHA